MKFQSISIEGFGSYGEQVALDLCNSGLTLINGLNGAGKSFLIEAIEWCLFGKTSRRLMADEYINRRYDHGCKVGLVINEERKDNWLYITRYRNHFRFGTGVRIDLGKAKGKLSDLPCWHNISKGSVADTNKVIADRLGMDFDTFSNSVMITGNQVSQFISGTDAERKNVLSRILNFDEIERARNATKGMLDDCKRELVSVEGKLTGADEFATLLTDSAKESTIVWLRQLKKELVEIENEIEESTKNQEQLKIQLADVRNIKINKDIIQKEIDELYLKIRVADCDINNIAFQEFILHNGIRERCADNNQINLKLEKISKDLDDISVDKHALKKAKKVQKTLDKRHKQLSAGIVEYGTKLISMREQEDKLVIKFNTLVNLKHPICPLCGQMVTDLQIEMFVEATQKDIHDIAGQTENITEKLESLESKLLHTTEQLELEKSYISNLKINIYKQEILEKTSADIAARIISNNVRIEAIENQLKIFNSTRIELNKEKSKIATEIEKLCGNIEGCNHQIYKYKGLEYKYDCEMSNYTYLVAERNGNAHNKEYKEKQLKAAISDMRRYNKYIQERDALIDKIRLLSILDGLLGWKGIKVTRMRTVVSMLEDFINKYLGLLSSELMLYSLIYDEEKGTYIQKITRDDLGECSFNMLSNGEKKKVMTAAAFALGELVGITNKCNLLCLDEADSGLDEFGQKALFEALEEFKQHKSDIFVITHLANLQNEVFDNTIRVKKENGFSQIKEN